MELEEVLEQCLGQNFVHMIISNPKKGGPMSRFSTS